MGVCFFPISLTVISRCNVAFSISLTDFPVQCQFPGTMSLSRYNVTFSQVERLNIRYLMQISHTGKIILQRARPAEDTAAILQL